MISEWVGTSLLTFREWRCDADLRLQTDASRKWGFGVVLGDHWMAVPWEWNQREVEVTNISVLELIPIVVAADTWGHTWSRMRIEFQTDNMAVAFAGRSWSPKLRHLGKLLRLLAGIAIHNNFEARFSHLPGKENPDADALSRGRIGDFKQRNPQADKNPTPYSVALLNNCLRKL